MRIAILAPGSRGDVQPYVALGRGLVAAGHEVRLATHEDFGSLVSSHGLEFVPVAGRVQDIAQSRGMQEKVEGGSFLAVMVQMAREAKGGAIALAEAALKASASADLVMAGIGGLFTASSVAEKLQIPLVQAHYIPFTPTAAYPSFILHRLPAWLGGAANRLSYRVAQQTLWQGFRSADNAARREVFDLPAAPLLGPFAALDSGAQLTLYGYSPHVIPPPDDWDRSVHVTGYWFLNDEPGWRPDRDLASFLAEGSPPVFIGFGSMSSRNPRETADLVVEAVSAAKRRAVLLTGWGGMEASDLPDSIFVIRSAPFSWLFPQMAAVVHHGGAGTTAEGLRSGVPSIVVPFFGDQPFWGQRVAALGVGPQPISRRRLTSSRLAEAIVEATSNEAIRMRAAELGKKIGAEDGVRTAVDLITSMR